MKLIIEIILKLKTNAWHFTYLKLKTSLSKQTSGSSILALVKYEYHSRFNYLGNSRSSWEFVFEFLADHSL